MKLFKLRIATIVLFIIMIVASGFIVQRNINKKIMKVETIIDEGWTLSINDEAFQDISVTQYKMPSLNVGDTVVLQKTLDDEAYKDTVLKIHTRYSAIHIYLDNELIYEYGSQYYESGQLIGNGYHFTALPEDYSGKELKLVYNIGEVNAFTSFDDIVLVDSTYVQYSLISRHLITFIIACFLFTMGLISIFCVALVEKSDNRMQMLLWLGLFAIFIASWMVCNNRIIELLYTDLHFICYLEYVSMYMTFISLPLFVAGLLRNKKQIVTVRLIALCFVLLSSVLVGLSVLNIIHLPKTVRIFHITAIIAIIIIIRMFAKEAIRNKKAERTFLAGIVCFLFFVILELIRYQYNKAVVLENAINQSFVPIGAMVFIISMIGSFFFRILERVSEELERKTLYEMAYKDALTGIRNRAWCEKIMNEYEREHKPVTIINMDLNYFKQVNDTYGHKTGDELLIRFSAILEDTFGEKVCVGRMGGDEFIAIMDYTEDEAVEKIMSKLFAKIEKENIKKEYEYTISVSYGFASDKSGTLTTPWKIYELADKNMYDFKNRVKQTIE